MVFARGVMGAKVAVSMPSGDDFHGRIIGLESNGFLVMDTAGQVEFAHIDVPEGEVVVPVFLEFQEPLLIGGGGTPKSTEVGAAGAFAD